LRKKIIQRKKNQKNKNDDTREIDSEIKKEDLIENKSKEDEINNQSKIKEDKINAPPIKGFNKITAKKEKRSSEISFGSSKNNLDFDKIELNLNTNNKNVKSFEDLTKEEREKNQIDNET